MNSKKNMRWIRALFVVATMILMAAMPVEAQASAKSTYSKGVSYYKNGKYKKARQQFKKLRKKANESCVKKMSSKMKKAYRKVVKKYDNKSTDTLYLQAYYLTDIDKDGKAELIIKNGYGAQATAYVYQYKNGKAKKLGSFGCFHGEFYYDPRGNGVTKMRCHQFTEIITTIKIKNGKLKLSDWGEMREITTGKISGYMYLPYQLEDHATFNSKTGLYDFDYSDLK